MTWVIPMVVLKLLSNLKKLNVPTSNALLDTNGMLKQGIGFRA
jgi:hypothetical protein